MKGKPKDLYRVFQAAVASIVILFTIGFAVNVYGDYSPTDIITYGSDADWVYTNPRIMRIDKNGIILWDKLLPFYRFRNRRRETADRNLTEDAFYFSTQLDENKMEGKSRILKLDANGEVVWDIPFSSEWICISANPVKGGIYVTARSEGLYKISKNGDIIWGPSKFGCLELGELSTDVTTGGIYVTAYYEKKVLKVDKDGNLIWDKFLDVGIQGVYLVRANPIDGGVYAGCSREPCNIFRLDKDGNIIWQKTNFPSVWTYGTGVSTIDGSLYIGSGWPHWLAKINMDGSVQWKIGPTCDYIPSIAVDIEDNVYVGGQRECQSIRKYNGGSGELIWSKKVGPDSWEGRYGITPVFTGMPSLVDTTPPTLEPEANQTILWPPNHRMADIVINANASDNSGLPVTLTASVSSNEPEDGTGDGDKAPDMTIPIIDQETGTITLQLRAERSGTGDGREYIISITAADSSGNSSTANVVITVPHAKKKK
jgi:hypothetical protein